MPSKFLVPQYIETEPKILGPITVRQFIIMLVMGLVDFILWQIFKSGNQIVGIAIIFVVSAIFIIFAFAKVNGQGFHYFFLNIVRTLKRPKLKVWRKSVLDKLPIEEEEEQRLRVPSKSMPPKSRLSDLSLLVDTGGAYNIEFDNGQMQADEDGLEDMDI